MPPKQPADPYAARLKQLTSTVQRVRGWVGSDPARTPELADALVELTGHRLRGHAFPEAAANARDSVSVASRLLMSHGPLGPYTPTADARRYLIAVVQLAAVQSGLGLPTAAGRTMAGAEALLDQLPELALAAELDPDTTSWALHNLGRAALADGKIARANGYADLAVSHLARSALGPGTELLTLDADRLLADARWAAGRADEAVAAGQRARRAYDAWVAGRLAEPGRLSPALRDRLVQPLPGTYGDLADRLAATGDLDRALVIRRELIATLRGVLTRTEVVRAALARALTDLAADLLAEDRAEEAQAAADEARALASAVSGPRADEIRLLAAAALGRSLLRGGDPVAARLVLEQAAAAAADADRVDDAYLVLLAELVEVQRRQDDDGADQAAASLAEAVAGVQAEQLWAGPPGVDPLVVIEDRARGVVSRPARPLPDWPAIEVERRFGADAAPGRPVAPPEPAQLEEERAEAHRAELARETAARADADRRAAEQREAERLAAEEAERARQERARRDVLESERRQAAEAAERAEVKRRREERIAAHQADELDNARSAWRAAEESGDRRALRAALERVVELLRERAAVEPEVYGNELVAALRGLSSARLRTGDLWGSRAPAREAKALAATLSG